ncbi:MAG: hypothetical protein Q8Q14_02790 [Gemmatimonadales bacterium]|nr:hypothetical protein [Gemmatimonadales bacterium]
MRRNPMTVRPDSIQFSPPPTSPRFAPIANRRANRVGSGPAACVRKTKKGWYAKLKGAYYLAKIGGQKQSQGQVLYQVWVVPQAGVPDGWKGWLPRCGTERLGRVRNQSRAMGQHARSGTISAAPTGPGNTWSLNDAIGAGCCVFVDGQGAYLTCDPQTTGGNHPLHGLEVQIQAVHEQEGLVTVCHPTFTEKCWRLPACPDQQGTPSTCCVRMGSFEHNGLTFTGMIECSDTTDALHGTPVMASQPFEQNGQMVVSFDVGGDVTATLPVCDLPPAGLIPKDVPPTGVDPKVECCVDATTTPPTLQQCTDPSLNGTPVDILDVDEQSGTVMVAVPWSSTPLQMPLCKEPPVRRPPPPDYEPPPPGRCPTCPPGTYLDTATGQCMTCPECPPPQDCPSCPPGYWTSPDGRCVQCPPNYLLDPVTGQCVPPGECPECPPPGECPPCPECPEYFPPPDMRQPPWPCCDDDEDCHVSPAPRLPHFPQPGPVPGCDPDDPCCFECSLDGAGTMANPCNPCRAGNRRRPRRVRRGRR